MIDVDGLNEADNHYPDKQRFKYNRAVECDVVGSV